jgi:hypothetical protein
VKRVGIISPFNALESPRKMVRDVLSSAGFSVNAMEAWSARARPPIETCREEVGQNHGAIVFAEADAGSMVPGQGLTYTEMEVFEYLRQHKPVLGFFPDGEHKIKRKHISWTTGARIETLEQLLSRFVTLRRYKYHSKLEALLLTALDDFNSDIALHGEHAARLAAFQSAATWEGQSINILAAIEIVEPFRSCALLAVPNFPGPLFRSFCKINGNHFEWVYVSPKDLAAIGTEYPVIHWVACRAFYSATSDSRGLVLTHLRSPSCSDTRSAATLGHNVIVLHPLIERQG